MKFIFVCHDTGNTTTILDTANTLLAQKNPPEIYFLIVGEAAESIFRGPVNKVHEDENRVILLSKWLTQTTLKSLNDRALTQDEIEIVKKKIVELKPDKAITTSSSFPTALVPYQISEILTGYLALQDNFIYNGDFLQDLLNNPFWVSIKGEWAMHVSFLVAMAQEQALLNKANEKLTCHVVGSSTIDKLYEAKVTQEKIDDIKQKLLAQNQYLLFISGSKTVEDDLELLDSLDFNMTISQGIALRMGLHPGTKNMQQYVEKIVEWLKNNPEFPAKLIITPAIKLKLTDLSILDANYICDVNLSGDEVFPAANALASAQPTTLASKAVITGIPAYCLPNYKNSYLFRFYKQSADELVQPTEEKQMLARRDLGFPEELAVDGISALLLGNRRLG